MKKTIAILLVTLMALFAIAPATMAHESGGFVSGLIGCLSGIRTSAAYNDGKVISWRDWIRWIPYANIVFFIVDGVDGASGITTAQLADKYGSLYY